MKIQADPTSIPVELDGEKPESDDPKEYEDKSWWFITGRKKILKIWNLLIPGCPIIKSHGKGNYVEMELAVQVEATVEMAMSISSFCEGRKDALFMMANADLSTWRRSPVANYSSNWTEEQINSYVPKTKLILDQHPCLRWGKSSAKEAWEAGKVHSSGIMQPVDFDYNWSENRSYWESTIVKTLSWV